MKNMTKRILALALAAAMSLSLTACGGGNDAGTDAGSDVASNAGEGKVFAEPTTMDVVVSSHVSWPFNQDWVIWDYIEEATGADLNFTVLVNSDLDTKLSLMMTSQKSLPDLLHTWQKKTVDDYALSGAYIPFSDNLDKMPNFTKFWEGIDEATKTDLFAMRTSGDGKMYSAPAYGTHTVNNLRTWIYRKDIFEKHNLKVPETTEELYQVAKQLKELYPDSYPLSFRTGLGKIAEWGPSWEPYFDKEGYYDFDNGVWKLGAQQPVMKDIVEFFLKLKNEGLIPPDFIDMPTKSWEELMSTDRGFITLDYIVRIDFFNKPNRQVNPDYTLALMAPPKPDTANAGQRLMKANLDFYGWTICNTGDEKGIDNAFKLVDWYYSDDAIDLVSWGKEGETYSVGENGKKAFILEGDEQPQNKYGIATYGAYQVLHTESNEALYTEEQVEACHNVMPYLMPRANPLMWLPFSEDQSKELQNLKADISNYIDEQISKFMLGQQPMSEWDAFQKGLEEMGAARLLEIYTEAYNAVMK